MSDSSSSSNRSDDSGLKSPKDGKLQTQSDPDDVLENQNLFDLADTTNFKITDETLLPGQLSTETSGIGYAGTESYDEMDKFNKPTDDFMEYAPPLGNFCSGSHTDSDLPRKITSPVHSSTADVLPHRQEPASLDDLCAVETSFISNESSTGNEQQSSSSTNGNNTDDPSGRVLLVPDVMPFERDCSCVEMLVPSSADHELQRGNMTLSNPAELPAKDIEMGAKAAAINAQHGKFVDSSSSSIDPYSKVASKKGQSKDIIDSGSSSIDPYSKVASNRGQSKGIIDSGSSSIDPYSKVAYKVRVSLTVAVQVLILTVKCLLRRDKARILLILEVQVLILTVKWHPTGNKVRVSLAVAQMCRKLVLTLTKYFTAMEAPASLGMISVMTM